MRYLTAWIRCHFDNFWVTVGLSDGQSDGLPCTGIEVGKQPTTCTVSIHPVDELALSRVGQEVDLAQRSEGKTPRLKILLSDGSTQYCVVIVRCHESLFH